jgi:hypothetical protein
VLKCWGVPSTNRGSAMMHAGIPNHSLPTGRLRWYAAVLVRAAVVLLLICAVTSAIVATGLDLLPLHP